MNFITSLLIIKAFRENKSETNPDKVKSQVEEAERGLKSIHTFGNPFKVSEFNNHLILNLDTRAYLELRSW